jgi:hypothetical protein
MEAGDNYEPGDYEPGDFAYIEITPKGPLYQDEFSIFLVQVVSESKAGGELLVDPIRFLRRNIPELRVLLAKDADVRASVLRVNAEISANPRHRSELWVAYGGSTNAIGLQYKYDRDMTQKAEQS